MKYRNILLFLAVSGFTCFAADAPQKPPGRMFRTIGMGVDESDLFYVDGKETKPLPIQSDQRSSFLPYESGVNPLLAVKMVPGPNGAPVPSEVARVALDASVRRFLLVFFKEKDSGHLSVMNLPDEARTIPNGGYRFINFLDVPAGVILGSQKQILQPGASLVLGASPANGQIVFSAQVYKMPDNKPTPVYSNIWSEEPDKRHLIIIAPSSESVTGVVVRRLSENFSSIPEDPPLKQ